MNDSVINKNAIIDIALSPFVVFGISFSILIWSLVTYFFCSTCAILLVAIAEIVVIVSIVYSIFFRKWWVLLKHLLSLVFISFFIFIAIGIGNIPFSDNLILTDKKFYDEKFKYHTSIDMIDAVDISCKNDTIYGSGPGGGDYRAICIYSINRKQAKLIENELKLDSNFREVSYSEYKNIVSDAKDLNCSNGIIYNNYGYKSGDSMYSYIIISKDKKHMLFCVDYY